MKIATRENYIAALKAHDWHFEASEDQTVWAAGRASLKRIQALQKTEDPDWEEWNKHAPLGFRYYRPTATSIAVAGKHLLAVDSNGRIWSRPFPPESPYQSDWSLLPPLPAIRARE